MSNIRDMNFVNKVFLQLLRIEKTVPTSNDLSMLTDYEGGGGLSVANDFMLMSFSYDYTFTVGTVYDLDKI